MGCVAHGGTILSIGDINVRTDLGYRNCHSRLPHVQRGFLIMGNLPNRNYVGINRAINAMISCNMTGVQVMSVARGRLAGLVLPVEFDAKRINIDLMGLTAEQLIEAVDGGDDCEKLCDPETVAALDYLFTEMA